MYKNTRKNRRNYKRINTKKKLRRKKSSLKQNFPIDVVYKSKTKMFKGKLNKDQVKIKKDGKIILPKNYYNKGFFYKKYPSSSFKKDIKKCKIKNQHGEIISLPLEYPGNNVIHQELNPERHKNIVLFDSDYFKQLYAKYKKLCL
jgi:hypothetical protein